jgi:hypothetical protein
MTDYGRKITHRVAGMLVALAAATAMTACSHGDPAGPVITSTPGPTTPAVDPSVAALQGEALRVYRGYLGALSAAYAAGDVTSPQLLDFLGDPLRTEVAFYMQKDLDSGEYYMGQIKPIDAKVTAMSLTTTPKTMTVSACLDYSTYRLVERKDNTPVPNATPFGRVPATATVTQFVNGQWLVSDSNASWSATC